MILRQSLRLHPSTIHEIAALIYGGVFTPVRAPEEIEQFFRMAGVSQDCNISINPNNSTRFETMGQIIDILEQLNTGSDGSETGLRQLSPGLELVLIYLVDPREYGRDLNVVTNISIRLNEILKFEKILVTLDESDGYAPKILPYSHEQADPVIEAKNTTVASRVIAAKAALKKEESDFNLKYAFYSIFGLALVVMIVLVITNYSKAAFSGADVILLFLIVSVIVLSLFGFGLNIFTRGEYRRFLENMLNLVRQLRP